MKTTHTHPPTPTAPSYFGLDVSKLTLACHLGGEAFTLTNDPAGHRALCARIRAQGGAVHVICEATGGYERRVVCALRNAQLPVSVLHPARARKLAEALGYLAKTDALDAAMLSTIGGLLAPAPTLAPEPGVERLAALVGRREALTELIRREKHHAESCTERDLQRDIAQSLAALEKRREKIEARITEQLAREPALGEKARRLREAPGIGPVAAASLLALLPELGSGPRNHIASLAGLAPRNRDSGAHSAARQVWGGRPAVRRILYLSALSAARHHPRLSAFYTRLRAAGKAPKAALIATARKLICHLHSALKNPNFSFA